MTDYAPWVGYAAGLLTSLCYVPQVLKVWREKSAEDISLKTMLVLACGVSLWTVFGLMKGDMPIILANITAVCLVGTIIALKLRFG